MDRKANESYLDYVRRCTRALEDGTIQYTEWGDSILGAENVYSADNLRKAFYVLAKILPKLDISQLSLDTNEEKERLEALQKEVIKERIKCRDQKRELQKYITSEARFDNLVEVLREEIRALEKNTVDIEIPQLEVDYGTNAVLCLSDWHCGAIVEASEWNEFNVNILRNRVETIIEKTLYHCKKNDVKQLIVEINGDMCEGLINVSNRVQAEENVINQLIIVSDILSQAIGKLADNLPKIKVVCTTGNHGRLVPDKNASIGKDNIERLLQEFLPLKLANYTNISFMFSDYDYICYDIGGKIICMSHGQYDKVNNAIENFVKLYQVVPQEIHLGHTHSFKDINNSNIRIVVNGSLKGADEYAVSVCREVNKPSQTLIIYGMDRAVYELTVD